MIFRCNKCENTFNNKYNFNKHINRKHPCNIILKCHTCDKLFDVYKDLNNHLNRKYPCKKPSVPEKSKSDIKLEMDIKKLEILTKNKLEIEDRKFQHKKELIELNKLAFIEKNTQIEMLKTTRKEKTVTNINNGNIINITNNVIQHIGAKYKDNEDISLLKANCEHAFDNMIYNFGEPPGETMLKIYDKSSSFTRNILEYCFEDPKSQSIFYIKELDKFFGIYVDKDYKIEIKETKFDTEVLPILTDCNIKFSDFLVNEIQKYKNLETTAEQDKYLMLYGHNAALKKGYTGIEYASKNIFEEKIPDQESTNA